MELKILQIQLYTWLSRCQDRHNKSKSLCHKMHEDQGYTHLSLGVQDNSLHTPVYGKHPQVILPLILPIEQKQGVVVWQFLIKRMTRPAGPSNWKCGVPLTLLNFWGPSSFIFYWVIPAYKWSPRLQPPVVTPPPSPTESAVTIGVYSTYLRRSPVFPPKGSYKRMDHIERQTF